MAVLASQSSNFVSSCFSGAVLRATARRTRDVSTAGMGVVCVCLSVCQPAGSGHHDSISETIPLQLCSLPPPSLLPPSPSSLPPPPPLLPSLPPPPPPPLRVPLRPWTPAAAASSWRVTRESRRSRRGSAPPLARPLTPFRASCSGSTSAMPENMFTHV